MFKKPTTQTKSFLILFTVAVVGTYLVTMLTRSNPLTNNGYQEKTYPENKGTVASASDVFMPAFSPVDTSNWKTYTDSDHNLTFKYEPAWKIKPEKEQDGFYILEIDPGAKYYNMKVYISQTGFYGIDGLPSTETSINGVAAKDVSNLLYGIQAGGFYYTFENGLSTAMLDNFNAWVRTATFQTNN